MAKPNKQPFGSRPGPLGAGSNAPRQGKTSTKGQAPAPKGVRPEGLHTPAGPANNKKPH